MSHAIRAFKPNPSALPDSEQVIRDFIEGDKTERAFARARISRAGRVLGWIVLHAHVHNGGIYFVQGMHLTGKYQRMFSPGGATLDYGFGNLRVQLVFAPPNVDAATTRRIGPDEAPVLTRYGDPEAYSDKDVALARCAVLNELLAFASLHPDFADIIPKQ